MLPFKETMWIPLILAIEGLIGCGKTTLTRTLSALMGYKAFFEPVEGNPYLADFYKVVTPPGWQGHLKEIIQKHISRITAAAAPNDPALDETVNSLMKDLDTIGATYSHIPAFMQLFLLTRRFQLYMAALYADAYGYQGALLDRSLQGDTVFARMLHEDGWINDRDMATYWGHWQRFKEFAPNPHAFVYLDTSPEMALQRMQERARDAEVGVPIEYLQRLHDHYEKFLTEMGRRAVIIRVPYDPPRPVYDAREFPEEYPSLQDIEDPTFRKILHPAEGHKIVEQIKVNFPEYKWFDRHRGNPDHMLSEVAK